MTTLKQSPCCARRQAKLIMDQVNLGRLARMASARVAKGLSTVAIAARIEEEKFTIEAAKQAIIDHDADHAGGGL